MNGVIFTGCDTVYWKKYGVSFVKSFKHFNPTLTIHVHIVNPDKSDIQSLESLQCSFSIEEISDDYIDSLVDSSLEVIASDNTEYKKNLKSSLKYYDDTIPVNVKIRNIIKFSCFACSRFIKLSKMWDGTYPIAAYDIDSICNKPIDILQMLNGKSEGCLEVKGNRFVVSLVAFSNNSTMVKEWGETLEYNFKNKTIYGFLDQDTFVDLSEKYNVERISNYYCSHSKKSINSAVITGKGSAKHSEFFIEAQKKWN